jgi:hypothetical protein
LGHPVADALGHADAVTDPDAVADAVLIPAEHAARTVADPSAGPAGRGG